MLKNYRNFLLALIMLNSLCAFSQNGFDMGYVVTNSGDTLKGLVKASQVDINPVRFSFKSGTDGSVRKFSLEDCASFSIYGQQVFERHNVKISLASTVLGHLSVGIDTSYKEELVFLKVLEKGKNIKLYVYRDDLKTRFYVKENSDTTPYELNYYTYISPTEQRVVKSNRYQGQLSMLFSRYGVSEREYYRLNGNIYNANDLVKIAQLVNGETVSKVKTGPIKISLFGGLGANYYKLNYYDDAAKSAKTSDKPGLYFSAGADINIIPSMKRFWVRLELSASQLNGKMDSELANIEHTLKQNYFTVSPSIFYDVYRSVNMRFYLGVGASVAFIDTKIDEGYKVYKYATPIILDLRGPYFYKSQITMPFSAGVFFGKRLELTVNYSPSFVITDDWYMPRDYVGFGISATRFRAGLTYHLYKN